jgi:hypothetical protein
MSYAVGRPPKDSAMISVELSGVATMPSGKAISSAAWPTAPPGMISTIIPQPRQRPGGTRRRRLR